jgi:hypothetical protein
MGVSVYVIQSLSTLTVNTNLIINSIKLLLAFHFKSLEDKNETVGIARIEIMMPDQIYRSTLILDS